MGLRPGEDLLQRQLLVVGHVQVLDLGGEDVALGAAHHVLEVPDRYRVLVRTVGAITLCEKIPDFFLGGHLGGDLRDWHADLLVCWCSFHSVAAAI